MVPKQKFGATIRFPEGLENTPLMLLSNVKLKEEDFFKFCALLRMSKFLDVQSFMNYIVHFQKFVSR